MSDSPTRALSYHDAAALDAGAAHYRAFVGPPQQYDLMGASQFSLLIALGLREHHRVLDFGCGSLRAGRFLIVYLMRGNYTGLEPNQWLVEDAIENQLGRDLVKIKSPQFYAFDDFRAERCGTQFDFILAQSIFSHTGVDLTATALASFRAALTPSGLAVATFIHPRLEVQTELAGNGWAYPQCVAHTPETIHRLASQAGLHGRAIPWFHPRQTWYVFSPDANRLPSADYDKYLRGAILNEPAWAPSLSDAR